MLVDVEGSCGLFNLYGYRDILAFARDAVACTNKSRDAARRHMDFLPKDFIIVRNGHMYKVLENGAVSEDIDKTMYALTHIPERNRRLSSAQRISVNESMRVLWVWLAGETLIPGDTW